MCERVLVNENASYRLVRTGYVVRVRVRVRGRFTLETVVFVYISYS